MASHAWGAIIYLKGRFRLDDITKMLANDLGRIKDAQEETNRQLSDINARLASMEAKVAMYDDLKESVDKLKEESAKDDGGKQLLAWIITTGIALYAAAKSCFT